MGTSAIKCGIWAFKESFTACRVSSTPCSGGEIPKGLLVAHVDGDKNNLSIDNLVLQDAREVGLKRSISERRELPPGVTKVGERFVAKVRGKYLGRFSTIEEASAAVSIALGE